MEEWHMPWLARRLAVVDSTDSGLIGLSGMVLEETRRTLLVDTGEKQVKLAKHVIQFTIDDSDRIDGSKVCQRPEDRIHRRYQNG